MMTTIIILRNQNPLSEEGEIFFEDCPKIHKVLHAMVEVGLAALGEAEVQVKAHVIGDLKTGSTKEILMD